MATKKYCGGCKNILDLEYFGTDRRSKDGKASHCTSCRRREKAIYNASHPLTPEQKERIRELQKVWMVKNKTRYLTMKKFTKRRWREKRRMLGLRVS